MKVKDKTTGKEYEYEIRTVNGEKKIVFKGIVTYSEWIRIKPELQKKYKWYYNE